MRLIFVFEIFQINSRYQKFSKIFKKIYIVAQIIEFQLVAVSSPQYRENDFHRMQCLSKRS